MTRALTSYALRLAVALVGLLLGAPAAATGLLPTAQGDAIQLGAPGAGETAFELIGKTEVRGTSLTYYGYLTSLAGLPAQALFTDAEVLSEAQARIVYFGSARIQTRSEIAGLIVVTAAGKVAFHVHENGGASFAAPESFFGGVAVSEAESRFQLILDVADDGQGTAVGTAELTILASEPFTLDGQLYQIGAEGLHLNWSTFGAATQAEPARPIFLAEAGLAIVPPVLGEESPAAIPTAETALPPTPTREPVTPTACPDVEPWFSETLARLAQAAEVTELAPEGATLAEIDGVAVRQLAATLATLATEQRDAAVPADETQANRLVVTALSTYGRALNLLASAVENQNQAAYERALALLNEARAAERLARSELAAIAERCGLET